MHRRQRARRSRGTDERIHQSLLSTPLGVELKFYYSPWCTLRLEACGCFGGRPTGYFPWHGNTAYW